jgi:hypothetical protein
VLGYGWPPPGGIADDPLNNAVQTAIREVAKLDEAYAAARADKRLSPAGQEEQVRPLRAKAEAAVRERRERVAAELAAVEAGRAALLAVPRLEPGDAAGAALDREVRERFGQLPEHQRKALHEAMRSGEQERVLLALARDPFAGPHAEFARGLWKERAQARHARAWAELEARAASASWADAALGGLQGVLAKAR